MEMPRSPRLGLPMPSVAPINRMPPRANSSAMPYRFVPKSGPPAPMSNGFPIDGSRSPRNMNPQPRPK